MSDIDPEKILRDAIANVRLLAEQGPLAIQPGWLAAESLNRVADAAEATLPRFKEVEVWRVEYAWEGVGAIGPRIEQRFTREQALAHAKNLGPSATCISVTGPHKQRVPA